MLGVGRCLLCPLGCSVSSWPHRLWSLLVAVVPVTPLSAWSKQARYWYSTGSHCCFFIGFQGCGFPTVTPVFPLISSNIFLGLSDPREGRPSFQIGLYPSAPISAKAGQGCGGSSSLPSASLFFASKKTCVFEAKMLGWRVLVQKSWYGEKELLLWPFTLHGAAKQGANRAEKSSGGGMPSSPSALHLCRYSPPAPSSLPSSSFPFCHLPLHPHTTPDSSLGQNYSLATLWVAAGCTTHLAASA